MRVEEGEGVWVEYLLRNPLTGFIITRDAFFFTETGLLRVGDVTHPIESPFWDDFCHIESICECILEEIAKKEDTTK